MYMTSKEIRARFLDFFSAREHKIVPSSSLVSDDPSVLLTTAGMQQFKKYFTGELEPDFKLPDGTPTKNVVSIQKCFRTSDIDEVGDESHLTFFEMLGNFSFGGYGKKEAIEYAHEFIAKEMGLKIDYVSIFGGDNEVPKDLESEKVWKSLGIKDIREAGREDNFWGPTGSEGPCGPTSEIYVNPVRSKSPKATAVPQAERTSNGVNGIEIWNLVFNEYYCDKNKKLTRLENLGIDTGMGLERLAMVSQGVKTVFDTDLFQPIFETLPAGIEEKTKRIFADHARGICFLIADGIRPANKEAGYVLRRLIRRLIAYRTQIDFQALCYSIARKYGNFYPELNAENIASVFNEENTTFVKTLSNGMKELNKLSNVDAKSAFKLYESFGLPYETIKEVAGEKAKNLTREDFDKEFQKHQEISRAGAEKKFGGHGLVLDTGELKAGNEEELQKVTRLHTATHLLQKALREVLGNEVEQRGSDITSERTRFDFSFPHKLTSEEIKQVESLVNKKIKEDLPVNFKEMPIEEAKKTGALYFFKEKYPEKVKVYFIGEDLEKAWSKEFCGGPHVKKTSEIGNFKIIKEESVAAGVRRIRATVL